EDGIRDFHVTGVQTCALPILKTLAMGVDLRGICIYPVIERPDWDNLDDLHKAGLWDMDELKNRIPHMDSLLELRLSMENFSAVIPEGQTSTTWTSSKAR